LEWRRRSLRIERSEIAWVEEPPKVAWELRSSDFEERSDENIERRSRESSEAR
jgi:hypothetical protein